MRRRTILRAVPAALGSAVAGCLDGTALAGDHEATTRTDGSGGPENRDDDRSTADATVELVVENRDDRPRSGTLAVTHVATPTCRYATPECGRPEERTTALDATFDLDAGERRAFDPVAVGVETGGDVVDSYSIETSSGSRTATLAGLEAGAAATVGRDRAAEYPWRVAAREYRVRVRLTGDGVEIGVGSVE